MSVNPNCLVHMLRFRDDVPGSYNFDPIHEENNKEAK
jgi:hypothetical protein